MKLRKHGNFATGAELDRWVEQRVDSGLTDAGLATQAALMKETPKITGHLQRGWFTDKPEWVGGKRIVRVKNGVIYARRRQFEGSSAGYVERGVDAAREQAIRIVKDAIRGAADGLWVK